MIWLKGMIHTCYEANKEKAKNKIKTATNTAIEKTGEQLIEAIRLGADSFCDALLDKVKKEPKHIEAEVIK